MFITICPVSQDDVAQRIVDAAISADRTDGLGYMEATPFDVGVRGGWRKAGPPHRQRLLRLSAAEPGKGLPMLSERLYSQTDTVGQCSMLVDPSVLFPCFGCWRVGFAWQRKRCVLKQQPTTSRSYPLPHTTSDPSDSGYVEIR